MLHFVGSLGIWPHGWPLFKPSSMVPCIIRIVTCLLWPCYADRLDAIEEEVLQQVAGRLPSELRVLDSVQQLPSRLGVCLKLTIQRLQIFCLWSWMSAMVDDCCCHVNNAQR